MNRIPGMITVLLATLGVAACTPGMEPLQYGVHECDHCRMTLVQERYGGEIVTNTGKVYTFDSVECLVAYQQNGAISADQIHSTYVADYSVPRTLIPIGEAKFLKSTQLLSPMGANITAFSCDQDVRGAQNVFGGDVISWSEVQDVVRSEWGGHRTMSTPGSSS